MRTQEEKKRLYARKIKALSTIYDTSVNTMATVTGLSRSTFYSRLDGSTPWKLQELDALCDFWGVDLGKFIGGEVL